MSRAPGGKNVVNSQDPVCSLAEEERGLSLGGYHLVEVLHRDADGCYARAVSPGRHDLLMCFLPEDGGNARPGRREKDSPPPIQGPCEMTFLPFQPVANLDNVLPVVAFGRARGYTILAYRFVRAIPLWVHLADTVVLSRKEALEVGLQVARALSALHDDSSFSAEVNVGTVFVSSETPGRAYLAHHGRLGRTVRSTHTTGHPLLKQLCCLAPEQAWGPCASPATDIFQLGSLMVTMLTGNRVVMKPEVRARGWESVEDGDYPDQSCWQGLRRGLREFVEKALSPQVRDRHATMAEVVCHLEREHSRAQIAEAVGDAVASEFRQAARKLAPAHARMQQRRTKRDARTPARHVEGKRTLRWLRAYGAGALLVLLMLVLGVGLFAGREGPAPPRARRRVQRTRRAVDSFRGRPASARRRARRRRGEPSPRKAMLVTVRRMRRTATNSSSFQTKKAFLHRCYADLPLTTREEVIAPDMLRALFRLSRKDPEGACQLVDTTLEKLETYLEQHGGTA